MGIGAPVGAPITPAGATIADRRAWRAEKNERAFPVAQRARNRPTFSTKNAIALPTMGITFESFSTKGKRWR